MTKTSVSTIFLLSEEQKKELMTQGYQDALEGYEKCCSHVTMPYYSLGHEAGQASLQKLETILKG